MPDASAQAGLELAPHPGPRRLALGLAALAWWALLLLTALAWGPAIAWGQAHRMANGEIPGAVKVQAPILAIRNLPASEGREAVHRLWVNTPDRGVLTFSAKTPFPADWVPGAPATLRRVPGYPSVNALDLPGSTAFTALEVWSVDLTKEAHFWVVPALATAGALGSLLGLLWAWRRPRLPQAFSALLGLGALATALGLGGLTYVIISIAKPNLQVGEAALLPVAAGPRPPEAVKVFVEAPAAWAPLAGRQALSVGAEEIAKVLGPQHRLMVVPNRVRQMLIYEAAIPSLDQEPAFVARFERAALAAPWVLALQGLLWLAFPLLAWRERRRQAKAGVAA